RHGRGRHLGDGRVLHVAGVGDVERRVALLGARGVAVAHRVRGDPLVGQVHAVAVGAGRLVHPAVDGGDRIAVAGGGDLAGRADAAAAGEVADAHERIRPAAVFRRRLGAHGAHRGDRRGAGAARIAGAAA